MPPWLTSSLKTSGTVSTTKPEMNVPARHSTPETPFSKPLDPTLTSATVALKRIPSAR
ncbi:hypothetical protein LINPERPRIM_LOCUS15693 [Linum perenne]